VQPTADEVIEKIELAAARNVAIAAPGVPERAAVIADEQEKMGRSRTLIIAQKCLVAAFDLVLAVTIATAALAGTNYRNGSMLRGRHVYCPQPSPYMFCKPPSPNDPTKSRPSKQKGH